MKKAYLTDFPFKCNKIKFCTLLNYWLIRKKIFTYFYYKFSPLNRMLYIKCGVNIHYLHNSGCCRSTVAPRMTVLSLYNIQKGWYITNLFCVILHKRRHHEQAHITSGHL